jgi:TetR/AcrR family transcriptional repressor of mexJK operon
VTTDPATTPAKRSPGRPPDLEKAERVLDAGWDLFLSHGFESVSIEAIAAAAGVSKVTVYKHYPDKTALFEATVLRATLGIEASQNLTEATGTLRERLERFGIGLMRFLGTRPAIAFHSFLAGEMRRHPALARRFYALGPGRTIANLAEIIAAAKARGELAVDDPHLAAEMLVGAWQGLTNYRLALDIDDGDYEATLMRRVRTGVDQFLKAYAPPTAA